MLRIPILILYFHSVSGTLTLLVTKEEDGVNTSIVNNIQARRGSSFVLTCSVWHGGAIDHRTWWIKSNKNVSLHELQFNRVRLKDQGEYVCSSYTYSIKKMIKLHVLPKGVSKQMKQQVHDWIYPIRHVRSNSDSSSSSESQEKRSQLGTNSAYVKFWAVAFVIVIIGMGIFFLYYLLKRYWWKANSISRLQQLRWVTPSTVVSELPVARIEEETCLSEPNCDLPPSYTEADLPPPYDEVINLRNHN
ncbi:hypothetical protein RN001_010877 [Aquatica leii]|uniref:Ig-like domain-containing protein n=1 Tax=Aquatica leii TaxID=1421715 RepID=A0AAN7S8R0_9COLE|nr:hypothetical protein RN001_010877 [Aquatica leii]